jgi:UPF0271 protein
VRQKTPTLLIDLNADLAEGRASDAELMQLVTSVNIACGAHAGGPSEMLAALELAHRLRLCVGAHPGFMDREEFGRKETAITPEDLRALLEYQVGALKSLSEGVGVIVEHLKPHGALYHQVMRDHDLAQTLLLVAKRHGLAVMGLPDVPLEQWSGLLGVRYIREGFADRRYRQDGSLMPRSQPDAMLRDPRQAAKQVRRLVEEQHVDSICIHGDEPDAVAFAASLRTQLLKEHINLLAR